MTHVTYVSSKGSELTHVSFSPSGKRAKEVIPVTLSAGPIALAADKTNALHLAVNSTDGLDYLSNGGGSGGSWTAPLTIDAQGGGALAVATDSDNHPHIFISAGGPVCEYHSEARQL